MDQITFRQIDAPQIRKDESEDSRKITFVASDGTRDSAGTVLSVENWDLDRFNKNGVIGYQHKVYGGWDDTDNPDNIIGKGHAYVDGDKLMVDVEFEPAEMNELADKVYKKLLFGSLRAVSVGFIPKGEGHWGTGDESARGLNPTYYYAGQELLEVSVVNIPANPNALKKSFIDEAVEAEMKRLQETVDEPDDSAARAAAEAEVRQRELEMEILIAGAALL